MVIISDVIADVDTSVNIFAVLEFVTSTYLGANASTKAN